MKNMFITLFLVVIPLCSMAQPEQPVEEWTGKTIFQVIDNGIVNSFFSKVMSNRVQQGQRQEYYNQETKQPP